MSIFDESLRKLAEQSELLLKEFHDQFHQDKITKRMSNISKMKYDLSDLFGEESSDFFKEITHIIIYCLFMIKNTSSKHLELEEIAENLPVKIDFIENLFSYLINDNFPVTISKRLNEILNILNSIEFMNGEKIQKLDEYPEEDDLISFYDHYLKVTDKLSKSVYGVYHTPISAIRYVFNSIQEILKTDFQKEFGLLDENIQTLDPAMGIGTFYNTIFAELVKREQYSLNELNVEQRLTKISKNFIGIELQVAPFVIAHLKLSQILVPQKFPLSKYNLMKMYKGNSLDFEEIKKSLGNIENSGNLTTILSEMLNGENIPVILGNPPYSISSKNNSDWIMQLLQDYKHNLNERNIQPLNDDYVKFIRLGQWIIDQNQVGIMVFITNNTFLDGIVFRQMRKSLLQSFNRLYILNLHGSVRKSVNLPDDMRRDENVFDIMQGVSISFFIKNRFQIKSEVYYYEIFGKRFKKLKWLHENSISNIQWQKLPLSTEYCFFSDKDLSGYNEYQQFWPLQKIFNEFSMASATGDDKSRVYLDYNDFQDKNEVKLQQYHYRPFDFRFVNRTNLQRARWKIMKHLKHDNIGLMVTRFLSGQEFHHSFVTDKMADRCIISTRSKEGAYLFPLFLFNNKGEQISNVCNEFKNQITNKFQKEVSDHEIFGYIYGILQHKKYKAKYLVFLKFDFPRIPLVNSYDEFSKISFLGSQLSKLHLGSDHLSISSDLHGQGDNRVIKPLYRQMNLYINKSQYFGNISHEMVDYKIGSYKVLNKWIKERKGRKLEKLEIENFKEIISKVEESIIICKRINKLDLFFT